MSRRGRDTEDIAVVGMAGRFPKARNLREFWRNLCGGVEGISFFTDAELIAAGAEAPRSDPNYVKARGVLEDADLFDAAFFGVKPKEAEVMDPQHRVFLECAWEALESAGYDPDKYDGSIGVFAGMSMNTYLASNLASRPDVLGLLGEYQVMLGNDKDFLPTRVSYKLNLKGPSLNIQTACSTSLVAVCVACQQLLNHQCDMALSGAVSISFPQKKGYVYQEGGIASPDGHCRAFDAKAAGTVAGEGVGIVVLKRLADALADGDSIHAVIKGFALNNDGSNKVGYTAPSVEGQADVIALAQVMAGVEPDSIGYVEAHGTGTPLGDPIEIEGLTRAFRAGTDRKNFCAVGSVKSNLGHLDTAAGVTGLIKTVLALQHKKLLPSLHFELPNPKIDFANSPFYVNAKLAEWKNGDTPRRAGVSSFGIGGTNAHVVLEEAPVEAPSAKSRPAQLIVLSAKTRTALEYAAANLAEHLGEHPELNFADVAYTLQVGRRDFAHRLMWVSRDAIDTAHALAALDPKRVITRVPENEQPPVVFLFPGQGAQQVNMGRELYEAEPAFREAVEVCAEMLKAGLGCDLRHMLYPDAGDLEAAQSQLTQTAVTQPAMFVIEYALAKLWMSWGVPPEAMLGHSIGEYVAACLAGVFSLEEALKLTAARGRLMQQLPAGTMLAVRLPEREVQPLLNNRISLAAVNGPSLCVVSGPTEAVEALRRQLQERQIACTPLQTSHAFHSAMMEPILAPFTELVRSVKRNAPKLPFLSNVTGTWITAEQATDPAYWASHLRQTVRFADGVGELLKVPERILLEVGPGHTLSGLAKQHPARTPKTLALSSLTRGRNESSDLEVLVSALGQLWLAGVSPDWWGFHMHEQRRRVPLPTYPFERKRFWVEPARSLFQQHARSMPGTTVPSPTSVAPEEPSEPSRNAEPAGSVAREDGRTSVTRKDEIVATLRTLLSELSGLNLACFDGAMSFTEMGFESLFLTQASLAIERQFGVPVAFRQLIEEFSTLDALAAFLDRTMPAASSVAPQGRAACPQSATTRQSRDFSSGTKISDSDVIDIPLTEAQRELWFASQMSDAASCSYNECRLLHLRGTLSSEALLAALQQLVDRHEALRTTFAPAGDWQRIRPALKLDVPVLDWSNLAAEEQTVRLDHAQFEEARQPFDLVRGPLLRGRLLRLGERQHVLVVTVHHIVCDGHSLGILLRELAELYSAAVRGVSGSLASPLQLSDYAREQSRRQASAGRADDEAYWLKQFADGAPVLELPTDSPRPAEWTFRGARACHSLPQSLGQDLKRLGAQQGCTLFTTLLAACVLLLRRLANQKDIVVGVPTADRTMAGGDTLVGHCVNFLPLRVQLSDEAAFSEHLGQVQRTFLDAHEHGRYTFGSLMQKLSLPRDASRMPLVSVTFNVERLNEALQFPGLETELAAIAHGFTNFDLSFNVTEIEGTLQLDCRYHAGLFSAATIQRWLGHFQILLEGLAANLQLRLGDVPLLSADERRQILVEWNETRADYPRDRCVHQLFEEQVERTPGAIAVVFQDKSLTYSELNGRADQLAGQLQQLGVGPDVPVGICVERSLEMLVGVLAILKAGGAYVPLDPAHPKQRLARMVENARVPLTLTHRALGEDFRSEISNCNWVFIEDLNARGGNWSAEANPKSEIRNPKSESLASVIHTSGSTGVPKGVAMPHRAVANLISWQLLDSPVQNGATPHTPFVVCLDPGWEAIARDLANPVGGATAESPAYVSFTSGSTGRPKGVCVPHRGVVRLVKNTNYARLGPDEVFLQLAPLAFDASTLEIWGPLLNGGRLIIFPSQTPTLTELGEFIQRHRITTLWLTAGLFHQMVEEQLDGLRGVRQLLAGGDVLSVPHVKKALERLNGCTLINGYGPTENTTFTCCHRVTSLSADTRSVPIGRPIANTQVYILDDYQQPVPVGVPGELYIGGDGLALGYVNRPELTAEKFVRHPFSLVPNARLYRTGDLVRWLPDGIIEFLGRIDTQVKIRGFRVELGEIETVLSQHPDVRECLVTAHADASGNKQLVAYFVSDAPGAPTTGELRAHLRRTLPDYMVPVVFMRLASLPLNTNGKVDRQALPAPDPSAQDSAGRYVAPRDPLEAQLVRIWEEVLGRQPIGVADHFFDLGGHSLMAVRLAARIEKVIGTKIPVASLFQSPTIAQLASVLREKPEAGENSSIVAIQPKGTKPPLFFIHGAGGGMFWGYTNLARHLGTDQPVHAFKSRGMDGLDEFDTIEEMAAHYAAELRAFQPDGPYCLGGYCFGGNVAYEVARQLRMQGAPIALLALIDCAPPNSSYNRIQITSAFGLKFLKNLGYWAGYLRRLKRDQQRDFLLWKLRAIKKKFLRLFKRSRGVSSDFDVEDLVDLSAQPEDRRKLWEAHVRALMRHQPRPYAGHVTLFRTRGHSLLCSFDDAYGWREFAAGGVTVKIVPGAHESILDEPQVQTLAEVMRQSLRDTQNHSPEENAR